MLALVWRILLRGLAVDLPHKIIEDLVDVDLGLGRRLQEGAGEGLGEVESLVLAHHAFILKVALVAHQDHRDFIRVLGRRGRGVMRG